MQCIMIKKADNGWIVYFQHPDTGTKEVAIFTNITDVVNHVEAKLSGLA